jgi:polyisoprenoid-binding protein YceI
MKLTYLLPVLFVALTACQTSSLTEEEKAPAPTSDTSFTGEYTEVDMSQSVVSFVGESPVVNHEGKFNTYTLDIATDAAEPANLEKATITMTFDIASIETDADGLTAHLQKPDFFDSAYPTATFKTTSIKQATAKDTYTLTGNMTAKGKTQPLSFNAVITDASMTASFPFPREEFGIGNASYGQKILSKTVPVTAKLIFKR